MNILTINNMQPKAASDLIIKLNPVASKFYRQRISCLGVIIELDVLHDLKWNRIQSNNSAIIATLNGIRIKFTNVDDAENLVRHLDELVMFFEAFKLFYRILESASLINDCPFTHFVDPNENEKILQKYKNILKS